MNIRRRFTPFHSGKLLAVVAFLMASPPVTAQVRPASHGEAKLLVAGRGMFAAEQYDHDGETFSLVSNGSDGSVSGLGLFFDAEAGFLTGFSLFFQGIYDTVQVDSGFATTETTGFGDMRLGIKWLAIDGQLPITVIGAAKFPSGYNPDAGPFRPTLGNGVNEYDLLIQSGVDFDAFPGWLAARTGMRIRGSRIPRGGGPSIDYAEQIPYHLEFGVVAGEVLLAQAVLEGVQSLSDPESIDQLKLVPLAENHVKLGATVGHEFADYFIVGIAYFQTIAGANTLRTHELTLGVSAKYEFIRREK